MTCMLTIQPLKENLKTRNKFESTMYHVLPIMLESAGSGSSALGQGTLSSLPSPSERT